GAAEESSCLPVFPFDVTAPTKRKPFRDIVRTSRCCPPLSLTALRTALMRLSSVESDTIRPFQTDAIKSSLLTTRSRFSTRWTRISKTWGSTGIIAPPARNSRRSLSSAKSSNKNSTLSPPQQTAQLYLRFRWIEINLASRQIDAFARTVSEAAGKLKTCRRSYETNVRSGPKKKLFQRLLRIISAMRAWCAKPARVNPLRINRFH